MSPNILAALIVAVWLATGLTLSVVMGRRGHLGLGWGLLGAMLGPLAVLAAFATTRQESEPPSLLAAPTSAGGPVDVVVGIDGSPESEQAVDRAIALLGPQLGRLTLATVVPYEDVAGHLAGVKAELAHQAELWRWVRPGQEILHGPPARTLCRFAAENGYSLLVVGTRGRGMSKAVLGSTAGALAAGAPVPVLMVGEGRQAETAAA